MKKKLLTIAKFAISFAILGYLFYQAWHNDQFKMVAESKKNWWYLLAAMLTTFSAVGLSILRWHLLVRSLNLPMRIADSYRIGFIGYLFQFLTLGVMGGDAVKAIFIARHHPQKKALAVTTVLVDRFLGLFSLFFVTSLAYTFFLEQPQQTDASWQSIVVACQFSLAMMILGTLSLTLLFWFPKLMMSKFMWRVFSVPKIGGLIRQLCMAVVAYRKRIDAIFLAFFMGLIIHSLLTASVYFVASGLADDHPTFSAHFVIVPIANVANAIPLPGGLGGFEFALDFLYVTFANAGGESELKSGFGLIVAFGFRLIMLMIAAVGVVFYLLHRREVNQLIEQAKLESN